jgi:hypothetical protein
LRNRSDHGDGTEQRGLPPIPASGSTVREVARRYRAGKDTVLGWLRSGRLGAINTAPPLAKPRYVILPHQLAAFEQANPASTPTPPRRRRKKKTYAVDYFPND